MLKSNRYEVNLEERVLLDFEEAFLYFESLSPDLSDNFYKMFLLALEKLLLNPHHYFNLSKKLRRISIGKFPYLMVYKIHGDVVVVIGLFHRSSKPSTWRKK